MIFHVSILFSALIIYLLLCTKKRTDKHEILYLRIVFILIFILMAFRGLSIGSDTPMYLRLFEECAKRKWDIVQFGGYYEPGYLALNVIISFFSKSPRFFLIIIASIICFSFYSFIKKNSNNYLLSVLIFIGLLFFYSSMNITRQFLSFSIIISSITFIRNKKLLPFFLMVVAASLFHSSAWIGLALYPLFNMKYSRKKAIIIFIAGLLASQMIGIIANKYMQTIGRTNYYESRVGGDNLGNLLSAIIYFCLFVFAKINISRKKTIKKYNHMDTICLYTLLCASMISLSGVQMDIMSRTIGYFSIFTLIDIPYIIETYCSDKAKNKALHIAISFMLLLIYSSTVITLRSEWNTAFNYKLCTTTNDCGIE